MVVQEKQNLEYRKYNDSDDNEKYCIYIIDYNYYPEEIKQMIRE